MNFNLCQNRSDMHKVQGISLPRSGHHLLVSCLKNYFEDELGYCSNLFRMDQFSEPETTFQKNHDFHLDLPIDPNLRYLIQYRHPLESLVSWYKWEVDHGIRAEMNYGLRPFINRRVPIWNLYTRRNTLTRWNTFLEARIPFWINFISKWIIDIDHPSVCYVDYSDFIRDPFNTLSRVIVFFKPEDSVDKVRLLEIISKQDIRPKSNIKEFKYYDERIFRDTETELIGYLNFADIASLYC